MEILLVLRKIKVENANTIAGLTWGFPAISNFLGFTHALSRKLSSSWGIALDGCGVICHSHQVQAHRPRRWSDYAFSLTRNPLTKEGKSPPFIEEGRMHMTVSLIISCQGFNRAVDKEDQIRIITDLILSQRLAGGTIINIEAVEMYNLPEDDEGLIKFERKQLRRLLPGFALVDRSDLLSEHIQRRRQENPNAEPLEAWLDFSAIQYEAEPLQEGQVDAEWRRVPKPSGGWLVPIAIGYRGISDLYEPGKVARTRDPKTPFRFVEQVYGIGKWVNPLRVDKLEKLIWRYKAKPQFGSYLCENLYHQKDKL